MWPHVILSFLIMIVLDTIWITSNTTMYRSMVAGVQKKPLSFRLDGAIFAYLFILGSFAFFYHYVYPATASATAAAAAAGLLGLIIYGIYNATNYAIFTDYPLHVAIFDTMWGAFGSFASVGIAVYIMNFRFR